MSKTYFFCGIGGSGMLPLAVFLRKKGARVLGSDRSYDAGKLAEKFQSLKNIGIEIFPQDGSGIAQTDILVVSTAVEDTIPDVRAAIEAGLPIIKRGALLAQLFNGADEKIAIAGTSGKSTVTGMVGTMLSGMGLDPSVINGGEVRNFESDFPSVRSGRDDLFVAEMDESDGSIAHYLPSIALLNNIALDHKSMEELEQLFGDYLSCADKAVIVNHDQPRIRDLLAKRAPDAKIISYGIKSDDVILRAIDMRTSQKGSSFTLVTGAKTYGVRLKVIGRHNVENALAALSVCVAMGMDIEQGIAALEEFLGIHRRMELIGTAGGVTVYDDFGHNPDKINASLEALKTFNGRLIVMFQPHGFGPLRLMGLEMIDVFAHHLSAEDILLMPEAYYAGGTVDRSVTAKQLLENFKAKGRQAQWFETRDEIPAYIKAHAREGDRIVIMGARDDTLHDFAQGILKMFE